MNETVYWTGIGNDTSDTTWGGYHYTGMPANAPGGTVPPCVTISGFGEPERDKNMRRLYRITVVNPKTEKIRDPVLVIARDEKGAALRAVAEGVIDGNPEDYDFCIEIVGDVRAKKETQKVKVVEGDEE